MAEIIMCLLGLCLEIICWVICIGVVVFGVITLRQILGGLWTTKHSKEK